MRGLFPHVWQTHGDGANHKPALGKTYPHLRVPGNQVCCVVCHKQLSSKGLFTHHWRTHGEGVNHKSNLSNAERARLGKQQIAGWSRGLTKETDVRVANAAKTQHRVWNDKVTSGTYVPIRQSDEALQRLSIAQSTKNRGGKTKWYDVSDQKVQGKWERELACAMERLAINWYKLKCHSDAWIYFDNDKRKSYTPDFYLDEYDIFIEVKGYWWKNDRRKTWLAIEQNSDKKLFLVELTLFKRLCVSKTREEFVKLLLCCTQ